MISKFTIFRLAWISVYLLGLIFSATAQEVLTRIQAIRVLAPEQAEQGIPVEVEAQVMRGTPFEVGVFIFDGEQGIYVESPEEKHLFDHVKPGDIIRIIGISQLGGFMPAVTAEKVEIIGHKSLPEAPPMESDQIDLAALDCKWVSVSGRVVSKNISEMYASIILGIELHGALFDVQVPYSEDEVRKVSDVMFRRVRFNAVAGTVFNTERQFTGRIFFVNSVGDLKPVEDVFGTVSVELPIHELLRVDADQFKAVKTYGVVTCSGDGEIFLRGKKSSLRAVMLDSEEVVPGDYVELSGVVWPQPIKPSFRANSLKILEQGGDEPLPVVIDEGDALDSRLQHELVQIDAELVDIGDTFGFSARTSNKAGQMSLLCRSGKYLFEARVPANELVDVKLRAGAQLRLVGICHLVQDDIIRWQVELDGYWLQLRSGDDITLLKDASWWTTKHLLWVSGLLASVLGLFFVWIIALRRTVDYQTAVIAAKVEQESVLNERQRIARELHDSLEQGLTGMAIQLKNCQKQIKVNEVDYLALSEGLEAHKALWVKGESRVRRAIEVVQRMLAHCRAESRTSILELRGGLFEEMDFQVAVHDMAKNLSAECQAQLDFTVEGEQRGMKLAAERNLFLVVREAVSNASRHANPTRIAVGLDYRGAGLRIRIADDGCGFDAEVAAQAGRFGLQGMNERMKKLNGQLLIERGHPEGTVILASIPATEALELNPS